MGNGKFKGVGSVDVATGYPVLFTEMKYDGYAGFGLHFAGSENRDDQPKTQ